MLKHIFTLPTNEYAVTITQLDIYVNHCYTNNNILQKHAVCHIFIKEAQIFMKYLTYKVHINRVKRT